MARPAQQDIRPPSRRAPHAVAEAPPSVVWSGHQGGALKPLNETDTDAVIGTAFELLEWVGMAGTPEAGLQALKAHGAFESDDGRLRLPEGHH